MDLNSIMTVVTLLVLGAICFWRWRVTRKASQMIGTPAPDTSEVDGRIPTASRVYYFYGERCRLCRDIAPMVDAAAAEYPNLIRVDVVKHLELAEQFGIMGTPTFVAVADGLIRDVKLESPGKAWLQAHLE